MGLVTAVMAWLLRLSWGRCEDRDYAAADNSLRRRLSASLICICGLTLRGIARRRATCCSEERKKKTVDRRQLNKSKGAGCYKKYRRICCRGERMKKALVRRKLKKAKVRDVTRSRRTCCREERKQEEEVDRRQLKKAKGH